MMKVINPIVVVVCAVFMTLSFSEAAQQGAKTPGKDPDKLTPQAKNAAEANDFNAIGANNDAAARLVLAETFRQKYPVSQLLGELHGLRMAALLNLKRFNEAIDELKAAVEWGDKYYNEQYTKAINKNSPALQELLRYKDNNELDNYRRMLDAAQAAQNVAVTVAMGDKILAKSPMDIPVMLTVARVVAQKPPPDKKTEALASAEEMGQVAVNQITTLLNNPNITMPPEQRNEWHYRAHSVMGLIYNQKGNYDDAVKAYKVALSFKKNDGVAFYYMGFALYSAKKYDEAIDAALKSAFVKGPLEANAKELVRELYRLTKKPTTDLDKDIQAAGERLSKL